MRVKICRLGEMDNFVFVPFRRPGSLTCKKAGLSPVPRTTGRPDHGLPTLIVNAALMTERCAERTAWRSGCRRPARVIDAARSQATATLRGPDRRVPAAGPSDPTPAAAW